MIREKKKDKKRKEFTFRKELLLSVKTIGLSFVFAVVISSYLSFSARNEMIKNLYVPKEKRVLIEQQVAKQIVANSDMISALHEKNYAIILHVGELYEAAGDLSNAEYAYFLATQKSPPGKYVSFLRLTLVLIAQNKIEDAINLINSVEDINNLELIRYKTRANIVLGDKYFSENKYLKAANAYEQANYYYSKLAKKDKVVQESIRQRLIKSYLEASSVILKNGYNSDAVRFLKKALNYDPNNLKIQYRLAIVYADLDPITSIQYFEPLISKIPQEIDRNIFSKTLIKAANIMELQGNSIKAKYYRYKIHSLEVYSNNKVAYKEDFDIILNSYSIKKILFKYKLVFDFSIKNISAQDVRNLSVEFVLRQDDTEKEKVLLDKVVTNKKPLYSNGGELDNLTVKFGKSIYTKKELEQYYIDVYLYKDANYKTHVTTFKVPTSSDHSSNIFVSPHL